MGTLNEDLTAIKAVEDKLTANQVAKFAYTQHAYDNPLTEADGVTSFNPENPQNIPLGRADILKVNPSVLQYGWRAQASAITRMLMNHFLGRVSYNLNKLNDNMSSLLTTVLSHLGTANGIATLDADGRIPYSQLPESAVELKGYWNAETNTPTLADGTGTSGDFYFVDVAGTRDLGSGEQYFAVGDRVLYDGVIWKNISSGNIKTINNRAPTATGNIDLTKSDVGLSNVDNTADSNMPVANGTTKFTTGGAHNMLTSLAPAFDATVSYSQGTIVSYQGRLYRCTTAHQGAWSDNDFAIANLNEGVGTSNVTGVKGEAESSYRSGNVNISMTDLIKNFKIIAGVPFLNYLGRKWKKVETIWNLSRFKFCNGLWLASQFQSALYVSEDAENWQKVADEYLVPIAYAGGLYLAWGDNVVWWSEDGRTWAEGTVSGETMTISYYPDKENKLFLYHEKLNIFEICTDNGVFYSEDGKTWQQGSFANATLPIDFRTTSIVANDNIMVVGDNQHSRIWWSEDGKIWTSVTLASSDVYSVSQGRVYYGNGEFFCCLYRQGLWRSTNGKTWSKISSTSSNNTWDYGTHTLFFNEGTKIWLDVMIDSEYDTLYMSWYIKGRGWSDLSSSNDGTVSPTTSAISINKNNTKYTAKHLYSLAFVHDDMAILSTDIGVFTVSVCLTSSNYGNGIDMGALYTPSAVSTSAQYYFPRVGYATYSYLASLMMRSYGNAGGLQGVIIPFFILSFENIIILSPRTTLNGDMLPLEGYPDTILISNDYGRSWKEIKLTEYDYINNQLRFYYGGGTLLTTVYKNSNFAELYVSNFNTCIEYIKEQSAYTYSS